MTDAEKEKLAKEEQVAINCFHRVFTSDDGKRILAWLTEYFGMNNPCFAAARFNTHEAAYRDGQRSVILQCDRMLNMPCVGDANIQQPKTKVIR